MWLWNIWFVFAEDCGWDGLRNWHGEGLGCWKHHILLLHRYPSLWHLLLIPIGLLHLLRLKSIFPLQLGRLALTVEPHVWMDKVVFIDWLPLRRIPNNLRRLLLLFNSLPFAWLLICVRILLTVSSIDGHVGWVLCGVKLARHLLPSSLHLPTIPIPLSILTNHTALP